VTVFVDTGLLITVPDNLLAADIVRRAGGLLIGTETPGTPLNPCDLLELDPDVILTFDDAPPISSLDHPDCPDAALGSDAVAIDGSLLTTAGPGVGEAVEEIARILHPESFN
jgi:ABC-type Fe3+-hydroxamate transport system substrate-binding protein